MFNSFSGVGNGTFTTSCPIGYNLISCTFDNNLPSALEKYRKVEPIDSKTCPCYDYFAIVCIAWCTTLPLTSFELVSQSGKADIAVGCPAGKQAMGCHLVPTSTTAELWRQYYSINYGSECHCYDYFGANCVASCGAVTDYEEVYAWGVGSIWISCQNPTNRVLSCGISPMGSSGGDMYRIARVFNPNTCMCSDKYGTYCLAICGKL